MFQTPMGYLAFFVLFTALLAREPDPVRSPRGRVGDRAGYNTEYSGAALQLFSSQSGGISG